MNGVEKKKNTAFSLLPGYLEMDQENYGATAEEVELEWRPTRSVVVGRTIKVQAHNQILRIRAEDSHVGEDIFGVVNFMLFSRRILPASPLSGKTGF